MNLLIIILCISTHIFAAQWATVSKDQAIIYSDQQMTSEIGYIKKGTKIRVGEVVRNRGSVLPIIVNKKVAYIKVRDIKSSKQEKLITTATTRRKELEIKPREESRIGFAYNRHLSTIEPINDTNTEEEISINAAALKGYLKSNYTSTTYAVDLEYSSVTDESELSEFKFYTIGFDILYRLVDFDNISLSASVGGIIIPLTQFSYDNLFTQNSSGYGASIGAEVFIGLDRSIGLHAGLRYRYIDILEFEVPKNEILGFEETYDPNFSGMSFQTAITYAF